VALGDSYATLLELKSRLGGVTGTGEDAALTNALAVASRGIEQVCGRQFNKTTSASARLFHPNSSRLAWVDDFHTITDLVIKTDAGDAGAYPTVWAASNYELEPLNGIQAGESGWPYWILHAVRMCFPTCTQRAPLQVTAQWGWTAVPAGVKEACLAVAEETYKLKDAPFGVTGVAEWGIVRVRANPLAMAMIERYQLYPVLVA